MLSRDPQVGRITRFYSIGMSGYCLLNASILFWHRSGLVQRVVLLGKRGKIVRLPLLGCYSSQNQLNLPAAGSVRRIEVRRRASEASPRSCSHC